VQITDCHLFAQPSGVMRGVVTRNSMIGVLRSMEGELQSCQAILATGDLAQDESEDAYRAFVALTAPLGKPVLCIPGNHDNPAFMDMQLAHQGFQIGGCATGGNWLIVMLSSHWPGNTGGKLSDKELERLKTLLGSHPEYHVLVCLHHQPIPVGSRWIDRIGLDNAEDFLRVLDQADNVRGVLWGHVHQEFQARRKDVLMMASPSTCHQFTRGSDDYAEDTLPPGYRVLDLHHDGHIHTRVCWAQDLGRTQGS